MLYVCTIVATNGTIVMNNAPVKSHGAMAVRKQGDAEWRSVVKLPKVACRSIVRDM